MFCYHIIDKRLYLFVKYFDQKATVNYVMLRYMLELTYQFLLLRSFFIRIK